MFKSSLIALFLLLIGISSKAQNCAADYGTVSAPQGLFTNVCQGGTTQNFVLSGNNTNPDYSSVFVVTDSDNEIAFINTSADINFAVLPNASGVFSVHALNILSADLALLQTAVAAGAISTFSELQTSIDNNQFCADLEQQGTSLTVAEPLTLDYTIHCDSLRGVFDISFAVSGGFPSLVDDPAVYYEYSGVLAGSSFDLGTAFTVVEQADGNGFVESVTDGLCGQTVTVEESSVACTKCHANAGIMAVSTLSQVCGGMIHILGALNAEATADSGAIVYALHTEPNNTLGTVLAVDFNFLDGFADFSGELPLGAEYGVTYYISSVGSNIDQETGLFDWNSECLSVATGTPIRFQPPISYSVDVTCISSDFNDVIITLAGENDPYTISSSWLNGTYNAGDQIAVDSVAAGTYTLTIGNTQGCAVNYEVEVCSSIAVQSIPDPRHWQMQVVPQPASQNAHIQFTANQNTPLQIRIHDLAGRTYYRQDVVATIGNNTFPVDLSQFNTGIYIVQISNEYGLATAKLIVK